MANNRQIFSPQGGPAPTQLFKQNFIRNDNLGSFDIYSRDAAVGEPYSQNPNAIGSDLISIDRQVQDGPFRLSVVIDVNQNATKQDLVEVPATTNDGKTVTQMIVSAVTFRRASTNIDTATGQLGFDANASNVVAGPIDLSDLTDNTKYDIVPADLGAVAGVPGDIFGFKTVTPQGAAATVQVDIFGYIIAALD